MISVNAAQTRFNSIGRDAMPALQWLIALICMLIYIAGACMLPIQQSPDEVTRLAVPFYIAQNGCLPNGFDESIRNDLWGISYAFTPYGSSLLSALLIKIAMLAGGDAAAQVVAARIPSCLFGALTVLCVMKIGKELGFRPSIVLSMGIGLGILPQFVFLSSYLNNDIFSAFCASAVILSWVKGIKSSWRYADCIMLGCSLGLLSLSYYFAYGLIPISIIVFFGTFWRTGAKATFVFNRALLVLLTALLVGGWFFAWNAVIYSGDFLGMRSYSECAEMYAAAEFKPSDHPTPKLAGLPFMSPLWDSSYRDSSWLKFTLKSSISGLGYLEYWLPSMVYRVVFAVLAVGWISSIVPNNKAPLLSGGKFSSDYVRRLLVVALVLSAIAPLLFSAYRSWATDYQPQGRYIISAWIPLLIFFAAGVERLTGTLHRRSSTRWLAIGLWPAASIVLFVMAVVSFSSVCFNGIGWGYAPADGPSIMVGLF